MFQNTSFGNKWFYAFITNAEYVNNDAAEITFEIDDMQTWAFDYEVKKSYVEREHSATDQIGDNLIPENLELGDYVYEDLGLTSLFDLPQIVIAATFDSNLDPATGGMYGGIYSGLKYLTFGSYTAANTFIDEVVEDNKESGIVSIYMLPVAFTRAFDQTVPEAYALERNKAYTNIDGYVPKCKKLFTYPYNMLYVTNNEGNAANYRFEYFSGEKCTFYCKGAMSCNPEVMLYPTYYKGVRENYNEKMVVANFPQCAYNIDTFKAYVAQNSMRIATNLAVGAVEVGTGIAAAANTGGQMGMQQVSGGAIQIANQLATLYDKSTLPNQAKGVQSSYINFAAGIKGFQFFYAHIRAEFAQIIDEYFNIFGYATHKVKVPNRNMRPHWNYVKTIDVNITGSIPADSMARIKAIYNSGVTFWMNGDEVGNYGLDNSPTITP